MSENKPTIQQIINSKEFNIQYRKFFNHIGEIAHPAGVLGPDEKEKLDELILTAYNEGFNEGLCK